MSTALAVAGVSAVLRDLLNDGMVNHNVSGMVGSTVTVTVLPPDRVDENEGGESSKLNLFLRHVTPNLSFRNEGLPARDGSGRNRLANAPLALDLHYVVSAHSGQDLHAEILLGFAMQLMHENPVFTRDAIRTALHPSPDVGPLLPPALRALADCGLEDQIEQLRVTPEYLDSDEITKFWTATQAHYRPSAAYRVAVVLIEARDAARMPLPVLVRQSVVLPHLVPPVPTIESVATAAGQPVAQLDSTITIKGHHLDGTNREVVLASDRFAFERALPAQPGDSATEIAFTIPDLMAPDIPAGAYRLHARMQRPAEAVPRTTNALALVITPRLDGLPLTVTRDAAGTASLTVSFVPALREGQRASLVLGSVELLPDPFVAPVTSLHFVVPDAPVGNHLARLRVDGIDSPIIDRTLTPPVFLDQRIEIQ